MRSACSKRDLALLFALTATLLWARPCVAGGPIHGARAAGMGTAFLAVADDPSAILHNPGGITQIEGTQVYSGVTAVILESSFTDDLGQTEDTEPNTFLPPHLFLTHRNPSSKFAYGMGVHSPFGIGGAGVARRRTDKVRGYRGGHLHRQPKPHDRNAGHPNILCSLWDRLHAGHEHQRDDA